ncbi:MAG: hypothetical protein J0L92_01305 [Deltaproteobacteria bacterium]|nr:hypothetical protein [Deltaproteobacteria bacterium]
MTKRDRGTRVSDEPWSHLAQRIADALRPHLPDVAPDEEGRHDSYVTGLSGPRKLDVTISTRRHGLELGITILSVREHVDVVRVEDALRREAEDLHGRQPHAVLVAYVVIERPLRDATAPSPEVEAIARVLAPRTRRRRVHVDHGVFEHVFVCLREEEGTFLDVAAAKRLSFSDTLGIVRATHRLRNER